MLDVVRYAYILSTTSSKQQPGANNMIILSYFKMSGADQNSIDTFVSRNTGFEDLFELVEAKGGYCPTIDVSSPARANLADVYDATQAARGDARRAYRTGTPAPASPTTTNRDTLTERVAQAKQDAKKEMSAPYMVATGLAYGCTDAAGDVCERQYTNRVGKKSLIEYIAYFEGIPAADVLTSAWRYIYSVDGHVEGADSLQAFVNGEAWVEAREYWTVSVTPADLKRGG